MRSAVILTSVTVVSFELNEGISELGIAVASDPNRNNETTFIVVAPRDGEIAKISGEYAIKEDGLLAANSNGYIATSMPTAFGLSEAYPNPFNPSTTLNFTLDADGSVAINVYNVMGQMVGTLHNGNMSAGTHSLTWDASDLSSGIYLVRAESAGNIATQKVMLMK